MKKSLVMALVLMFIVSIAGTAFAATGTDNPFTTVPAKHWAYPAITQLVKAGLIDGYGDGDFRGDRPATRYEMAVLTAKAMSNVEKADAANKALITKLSAEYAAELSNLGVRVAKAESEIKDIKKQIGGISLSGLFRIRYEHQVDWQGADESKYKNTKKGHYFFQLNADSKLNDNGWENHAVLLGARDWSGNQIGSGENTSGYGNFDISQMYVTGPVGDGKLKVGRWKNGTIFGLVNNNYNNGLSYSFGDKVKTTITYAKPDHQWYKAYDDATSSSGTDDRGANTSWFNPGETELSKVDDVNLAAKTGITYGSIDLAYDTSKNTTIYGAYYHTTSANDVNRKARIGELAFQTKFGGKNMFTWRGSYGKSNADDNNKFYYTKLTYNKADKKIAHSWDLSYEYAHMENKSYLKTTTDVNSKLNGRQGYAFIFQYVPVKNVLWYTRWLDAKDINSVGTWTHEKWLRSQIEFYF